MNDKKFWVIIGILMLIFVGLLLWPNKKQTESENQKVAGNIFEPTPDFAMDKIKKVDWTKLVEKEYGKVKAMTVSQKNIDINERVEIKNLIVSESKLNSPIFNYDENRRSFELNGNIMEKKQIEKGGLKSDEIKTIFVETMAKLNPVTKMETKIEATTYKEFLTPWWVSGTEEKADSIEIQANYVYENIPIKTFGGYMIRANYLTNGKLVKMENQLPFEKIVNSKEKVLWTLSELKNLETQQFKVWRVDGGLNYELSEDAVNIDTVILSDYSLEYIYDIKSGVVWPYYFLNGESDLKTGKAKVKLIISAVKEQ